MHNGVTSHLWLKSALHASSHPCMCTCVLRLGCFLLACLVLYFVPPFSFQPFLMFTSEFNERSRSNPLCDFRLGTVVTSDRETPLTGYEPKKDLILVNTEELDLAATSDVQSTTLQVEGTRCGSDSLLVSYLLHEATEECACFKFVAQCIVTNS